MLGLNQQPDSTVNLTPSPSIVMDPLENPRVYSVCYHVYMADILVCAHDNI